MASIAGPRVSHQAAGPFQAGRFTAWICLLFLVGVFVGLAAVAFIAGVVGSVVAFGIEGRCLEYRLGWLGFGRPRLSSAYLQALSATLALPRSSV